jgi:hypothetical protein
MTDKNTKDITELTPATLENMPVTQKIAAYEEILIDQVKYTERLEEIKRKGNAVLEPAGVAFAEYLPQSEVKIPKKRNADPILYAFAQRIGNNVSSILANGSTSETSLEEYLGKESYAKLKAIAEENSIQGYGSKDFDEKESQRVWQEFVKVRKEYQEAREELEKANRKMDQANQYVSYVQKLADVASKTKRLMK